MGQRTYDISTTAEAARKAFDRLRAQHQPGERTGKGSKTEVIRTLKKEIQALLREGYTGQQIADALKDDVFSILPKTITEIVGPPPTRSSRPPTKKKMGEQTGQPASSRVAILPGNGGGHRSGNGPDNQPKNEPQNVIPGSFNIQPDSEDL